MRYRYVAAAVAIACAALLAFANSASAQAWPSKPVRIIVPFSAGSATDIIPRTVFEQVGKQLGQSFVVENRVGAGGTIGVAAVAKADPDGYTLLVHSTAHVVAPAIHANLPYDVVRDFTGVGLLGTQSFVLIISPAKNIKTLQELVAYAKSRPEGIPYASAGAGTPTHLVGTHFGLTMGFKTQHIPFKGGPEGVTEVMAGRVDIYFVPVLPALSLIREGKLLALAVTGTKRDPVLPNVPTAIEAGYPESDFGLWNGVWVPAKTPRDIVAKLNAEIVKAVQDQSVRERLAKLGVEPTTMRPEEFDAFVKQQVARYAALAKVAGIEAK